MTELDSNIAVDAEGYLVNLSDWSPEIALHIAAQMNIELSPEHWEVIEVIRAFYSTYQMSPAMRPFVKAVKLALGETKGRSIHLMRLFPESPAKQAAKIGGLPKPTNCL